VLLSGDCVSEIGQHLVEAHHQRVRGHRFTLEC
jgi:hypothetical protein